MVARLAHLETFMPKPYNRYSESGVRLSKSVAHDGGEMAISADAQYSWANTATGTTMPNWRDRISRSEDAGTPFSAFSHEAQASPGTLWRKGWLDESHHPALERECVNVGDFDQTDYRGNLHTGVSDDKAISMAASQFYEKAHDAIVALEGGELLGELGQTVKEIKRLASEGAHLLLDWQGVIKRARRIKKKGRALTGLISESYLRWKFGWDPLVQDVKTLANDLKEDNVDVVPIKAHGKDIFCSSSEVAAVNDNNLMPCSKSIKKTEETSVRHKAGVLVQRYGVGGLSETLGLSPSNFLPTIYNLLPWTYMIDYFSNLGSIVNAIAVSDARFAWVSTTIRRIATVEVLSGINPKAPPGIPDWDDAPGFPIVIPSRILWTSKSVIRSPNNVPEIPSFYMKIPNFATTGGAIQGVNIAAVLASLAFGTKEMSRYRNG
jgi:hypothetical protein